MIHLNRTTHNADCISLPYGDGPSQVADLYRPPGTVALPVVVLIHGGFWRAGYDRSLMNPLARDLARRGIAVWNLEYRRVGEVGGGWPGTFADVAAGIDHLADVAAGENMDAGRIVLVGHSAGGHLALWAAGRASLPPDAPGAAPRVLPCAVVAQAAVTDLKSCWAHGLGRGAAGQLLGGSPLDVPDRYEVGCISTRLPLGVRQLLVHGSADTIVPVSHSRGHAADAVTAGDKVDFVELQGAGHFSVIDPGHDAWLAVVEELPVLCS